MVRFGPIQLVKKKSNQSDLKVRFSSLKMFMKLRSYLSSSFQNIVQDTDIYRSRDRLLGHSVGVRKTEFTPALGEGGGKEQKLLFTRFVLLTPNPRTKLISGDFHTCARTLDTRFMASEVDKHSWYKHTDER